jgi:hypothetical protein
MSETNTLKENTLETESNIDLETNTLKESTFESKSNIDLDTITVISETCKDSRINLTNPNPPRKYKYKLIIQRLFGINIEKFLIFTSLIMNALGCVLLSDKNLNKEIYFIATILFLSSWIFLFTRFIKIES